MLRSFAAAFCGAALLAVPEARADFIIEIDYSGDESFRQSFEDAADIWEGLLSGYQSGIDNTLVIDASVEFIDGAGGPDGNILGSAGPRTGFRDSLGFFIAATGEMQFDSFDYSSPNDPGFFDVVLHEMAHVMGFGTLWDLNNVLDAAGDFVGGNAVAAWQTEFGQIGATAVPVERDGGIGTAGGHWDEVEGGAAPTGFTVVDPTSENFGRDLRGEIMTGWLNNDPYISDMTIASFVDIGFVAAPQAVPEPGSMLLLAVGGVGAVGLRRRKRAAGGSVVEVDA